MVAVLKSPADKKEYRHIVLDNGLRALLVHDAEIVDVDAPEDGQEHEHACLTGHTSDEEEQQSGDEVRGA